MTQSGQGDEQQLPAVRPAHEGVVLPAEGGAWAAGGHAGGPAPDGAAPAGGQPWGDAWGPQAAHPAGPLPGQLPPEQPPGGYAPQPGPYEPAQQPYPAQQSYAPRQDPYQQQYQQQPGSPRYQQYGQSLPPEAGAGVPGGDADATQYIAPVPGGHGPAGMPPERPAEATQHLGGPVQAGDADATQYIPPVPGGAPYGIRPGTPGDRQPPAEFDSLFREEGPAGATQQMPHVDSARRQPQPHPGAHGRPQPTPPPYGSGLQGVQGVQGVQEPEDHGPGTQRRRSAHIPLIAAVVVGCAVVGLGAGALLSGGDEGSSDDKQPVAAQSSSGADPSTQAAADPAKPQAEALDKLLADSNNSRAAVISAVEKIKNCTALDQAATDLKGAAAQRRDLVTRLDGLAVDQLPDNAGLKSSLTKAWRASAQADDEYAAWAGQAKHGKKVCKGGKARSTDAKARADAASGEATQAKQEASGLWNAIAEKYALTKRTPQQL
ncbi:hypothetical protein [Streptomyces griseus]|uniref:hypothetical protein n=1 Tax=Streptomyces griseus TaxID=1911 RepID=UPI000AFADAD6|nr:hypothetical protein [Streptomyces griseus]